MSENRFNRYRIFVIILLATGMSLIAVSGLRSVPDEQKTYIASERNTFISEIKMPDGPIRINEAGTEELTELNGIGEKLASSIIDERWKNGSYWYPEDLTSVKGIGNKTLEDIREFINLD